MIKKHTIKGSTDTTLHDFKIYTEGMDLFISGIHYINQNEKLLENEDGVPVQVSILESKKDTWYEIWLTTDGVSVLSRTQNDSFGTLENPIDRLAWLKIPADTVNLDDIEINTVVMK